MERLLESLNVKLDELEQVLKEERQAVLALDSEAMERLLVRRESIQEEIKALEDRRADLFRIMDLPLEGPIETVKDHLPKEAKESLLPNIRAFKERIGRISTAVAELKSLTACSLAWLDGLFLVMGQAGHEYGGQRYTPYGAIENQGGVAQMVSRRT